MQIWNRSQERERRWQQWRTSSASWDTHFQMHSRQHGGELRKAWPWESRAWLLTTGRSFYSSLHKESLLTSPKWCQTIKKGFPDTLHEALESLYLCGFWSPGTCLQILAHLKDIKFNNGCLSGFIVCRICWIFKVFLLSCFIWFYIKWCQSGVKFRLVP